MPEGRIRENADLTQQHEGEPGTASLRGNQITEYRPDLTQITDPFTAHAMRWAQDAIYQLAGAMFPPKEEPDIPELTVPEANPMITPPEPPVPPDEECVVTLIPAPTPTIMSFAFGGENAFAPGDGFLYTGNQIQGRIEIVNYMNLPTTSPFECGQYDFPGGFKNMRVAVYGDTMYVTNGGGGTFWIEILDVTDRTNPLLLPQLPTADPNDTLLVFLRDAASTCLCRPMMAAVAPGTSVLSLYSLEVDPTVPVLLDTISDTYNVSTGLNASKRGFLFAASAGSTLYAYDISNPTNIQFVSSVATPGIQFRSFYQSYGFGYLYLTGAAVNTIDIWDVRDPNTMVQVGTVATLGSPVSTSVDGSILFVTSNTSGGNPGTLELFDLLDPTTPNALATYVLPTLSTYTYGLLTRDGAYAAHFPTAGAPGFSWFAIEYPICCNCRPSLLLPTRF